MRRLLFIICLAVTAGCFSRPRPACEFLCGPSNDCPADYTCSADDNRCHLVDNGVTQACTDMLPMPPDATPPTPDAGPPDARPPDAAPAPDATEIDAPIDIDAAIDAPLDAPLDIDATP